MKTPLEMLVSLLVRGGRFEQDSFVFAMADDGSLCVVLQDEDGDEIYAKVHTDVSELKCFADKMGTNELWLRCCALQLHPPKRTKGTRERSGLIVVPAEDGALEWGPTPINDRQSAASAGTKPTKKKNIRLLARIETMQANLRSLYADSTATQTEILEAFELLKNEVQAHIDQLNEEIDSN